MWNTSIIYTRIKLCLFEHFEAAYEASRSGADALGFHILKSNKEGWREKADKFRVWLQALPSSVEKVLLIDYDFETTLECLQIAPFTNIQLYPDWDAEMITQLRQLLDRPVRIMKVMSAKAEENNPSDFFEFIQKYQGVADGILLDSCREGGSGRLADLSVCSKIVRQCPIPVFLAGGLNAENVGKAIEIVRPFGVDVETGVSDVVPGMGLLKNMAKCNTFVSAVAYTDRSFFRMAASDNPKNESND